MDWTLENDITLCDFNLQCDPGEYAIYNLQGNLVAERSESLKVEFADQKRSFRQFSNYSLGFIGCNLAYAIFGTTGKNLKRSFARSNIFLQNLPRRVKSPNLILKIEVSVRVSLWDRVLTLQIVDYTYYSAIVIENNKSGNSYDSNFPTNSRGDDVVNTAVGSLSAKLILKANEIPGMAWNRHFFQLKMQCLKGVILDSGKLIHVVEGEQIGYNQVRDQLI